MFMYIYICICLYMYIIMYIYIYIYSKTKKKRIPIPNNSKKIRPIFKIWHIFKYIEGFCHPQNRKVTSPYRGKGSLHP